MSAAYGGALQRRKISILVDPKQISVDSKCDKEKENKGVLCSAACYAIVVSAWATFGRGSHLFDGVLSAVADAADSKIQHCIFFIVIQWTMCHDTIGCFTQI